MTPWRALYVKELKQIRLVAAIAVAGTAALGIYAVGGASAEPSVSAAAGLVALPYLSAPFLPFLLIHSISSEWNGRTHYQLLSLPVPRSCLMLAKVAAVASLGAAVFALNTLATAEVCRRLAQRGDLPIQGGPVGAGEVGLAIASFYWGALLLLLGIASAAAGLRVLVPRFKGLATVAVFLAGLYVYGKLLHHGMSLLQGTVGRWTMATGPEVMSGAHLMLITAALAGGLFLAIGAVLFERHVEA